MTPEQREQYEQTRAERAQFDALRCPELARARRAALRFVVDGRRITAEQLAKLADCAVKDARAVLAALTAERQLQDATEKGKARSWTRGPRWESA